MSACYLFHSSAWADQVWVPSSKSHVEFKAKITGGTFVTKSQNINGVVVFTDDRKKIKSAQLSVPVTSLDSGMSLRNDHMHNKFLEAKDHPNIVFSMAETDVVAKGIAKVDGQWTIKKVSRSIPLEVRVDRADAKSWEFKTEFPLNITDFNIEQPKFTVVKMDTVIQMKVVLVLEPKP